MPSFGTAINGPARVIDGDTIQVRGTRIRLEGIDAAELNAGEGKRARIAMRQIVGDSHIVCHLAGYKSYKREVATCFTLDGMDIGEELIRRGWAIEDTRYTNRYETAEREAVDADRGRWDDGKEYYYVFEKKLSSSDVNMAVSVLAVIIAALLGAVIQYLAANHAAMRTEKQRASQIRNLLLSTFSDLVIMCDVSTISTISISADKKPTSSLLPMLGFAKNLEFAISLFRQVAADTKYLSPAEISSIGNAVSSQEHVLHKYLNEDEDLTEGVSSVDLLNMLRDTIMAIMNLSKTTPSISDKLRTVVGLYVTHYALLIARDFRYEANDSFAIELSYNAELEDLSEIVRFFGTDKEWQEISTLFINFSVEKISFEFENPSIVGSISEREINFRAHRML